MTFAGALALLSWNISAAAQQPASAPAAVEPSSAASGAAAQTSANNLKIRVNVVNVPVSVLGRDGRPLIDLTQNDFQVFEDGKLQSIKYFYRGTRPPLRIGLIIDTSNSARRVLQFQKDAASEFVFNMLQGESSRNKIFLQTFDATSSILHDFTNDPEPLNEKILGLKAAGGKAFYDAIYSACKDKMLTLGSPAEARRVLVVVSDGLDVQSKHTLEEAISMARKAETAVYLLDNAPYGFDNPGDEVLKEISQATGGAALFPQRQEPGTDLETGYLSHGQVGETSQNKGLGASSGIYSAEQLIQLSDALESISRELTDQYNIGYTPVNDLMDGTYRTIRVEVARRGVLVRFKPGYFASPQ